MPRIGELFGRGLSLRRWNSGAVGADAEPIPAPLLVQTGNTGGARTRGRFLHGSDRAGARGSSAGPLTCKRFSDFSSGAFAEAVDRC